jgi:hypothetical protein
VSAAKGLEPLPIFYEISDQLLLLWNIMFTCELCVLLAWQIADHFPPSLLKCFRIASDMCMGDTDTLRRMLHIDLLKFVTRVSSPTAYVARLL